MPAEKRDAARLIVFMQLFRVGRTIAMLQFYHLPAPSGYPPIKGCY